MRHWSAPGRLVGVSWTLLTLLGRLESSWEGVGKVLAGFWKDLGKIFGRYLGFRDPCAASPTRLASQCAGVPPPAWLNPVLLGSLGPKALQRGVRTSRRGLSTAVDGRRTFSSWAPSWLQVRSFSRFVCIFFARCFEVAFFIVPRWFLNGFWEVWGRFWGCFGGGFSHDFQKIRFFEK